MSKLLIYTATISGVTLGTGVGQDLFELVAPSDSWVQIRGVWVHQTSDAGDALADIIPLEMIRGHTTTGSGGAAVTPRGVQDPTVTSRSTVARNNTTVATGGTPHTVWSDGWNIAAGFPWVPLVEQEYINVRAGERFVVRAGAPTSDVTVYATLKFGEYTP